VKVANLRTMPASELEIYLADVLRKPLDQVAPETMADALALAEVDSLPKRLLQGLVAFSKQVAGEITDVPSGPPFLALLRELDALDGAHVPWSLRAMIRREGESLDRDPEERKVAIVLSDKWDAVAFEPATPGSAPSAMPAVKKLAGPMVIDDDDQPAKATKSKGPSRRRMAVLEDARGEFVRDHALARLGGHSEGLLEAVLVAGICHKARESAFSDLQRHEVLAVLRALKEIGHVSNSAGRWKRTLPY
jgi:hypothetical protein